MTLQLVKETTNKNIPIIRGVFIGITALGALGAYHGRGSNTSLMDIIDNPIFTAFCIVAFIGGLLGILITYGFDSLTETVGSIDFSDTIVVTEHQQATIIAYGEISEIFLHGLKAEIYSLRIASKEYKVIVNSQSNINYLKKVVEDKGLKLYYTSSAPSIF